MVAAHAVPENGADNVTVGADVYPRPHLDTLICVNRSVAPVTVGGTTYPLPLIVTVTVSILPFNTVQVAAAPDPAPVGVNTIVGGVVNPNPPLTMVTLTT